MFAASVRSSHASINEPIWRANVRVFTPRCPRHGMDQIGLQSLHPYRYSLLRDSSPFVGSYTPKAEDPHYENAMIITPEACSQLMLVPRFKEREQGFVVAQPATPS